MRKRGTSAKEKEERGRLPRREEEKLSDVGEENKGRGNKAKEKRVFRKSKGN